ncbi:MAG: ABC transporter permease [Ignavibacteria bacterium]|nr:MAG: ABC transporter permease [Ignavibacteria bacterium]
MKQSFYLAYKYLTFNKFRTLVLIASIGIIIFLPNGLQKLITESEQQMMSRANSTPLIVGAKGSSTDLVINSLYFQQEKIENIKSNVADKLDDTGLGYSIPILSAFNARGFPIVGTTLEYFTFRKLNLQNGRKMTYIGECVVGYKVAQDLNLSPGDSLISSPENYFDFAGVYPLKMNVVGILNPSDTPDDKAIFTDLKTNWIIVGLGHGHQDVTKTTDQSIILNKDSNNVTANAKLFIYNEINQKTLESFHFHGDIRNYPLTSVIFVPKDQKSNTILRGRFEAAEMPNQIVVPVKVVGNLLQSIFRIKEIFNTVFVLVGFATILILGLIVTLSIRLRKDEIFTMFTIGSSRAKVTEIISFELLIIIICSAAVALVLYYLTGFFIEEFINYYIIG